MITFFSFVNFPAESRLKGFLSAIAVYTQSVTSRLKAERKGKKSTCMVCLYRLSEDFLR
jgi:hypothetical protein